MRVLVTCWPFVGHVLPQLAIAEALRDRGHEVAFYTGASAADTITGAGFGLHPMAAETEAEAYACVRDLETGAAGRPDPGLVRRTFRRWLVDTIPAQLADLDPLLAAWSPDVIVTDLSLWAPIVVLADGGDVPVALSSTFMGPLLPGPDAPVAGFGLRPPRTVVGRTLTRLAEALVVRAGAGLRERVDEIRADRGLPPLGTTVNVRTAALPLYLVPSLARLDHDRSDLPPTVHYVGPTLAYPPSTPAAEDWLEDIPVDRPWVHVTESTLGYRDPFLLRAAVHGLPPAGVRVIATTGTHRDPGTLDLGLAGGALPDAVHLTDWVSHAALLPRCRAVVANGGTSTVLSALAVGVPLVIVPTTWDKPDNARRVADAGAGVVLRPSRCTPERLRAAVQELLDDPTYERNARAIAAELAAAPGAAGAARLLERLPVREVAS